MPLIHVPKGKTRHVTMLCNSQFSSPFKSRFFYVLCWISIQVLSNEEIHEKILTSQSPRSRRWRWKFSNVNDFFISKLHENAEFQSTFIFTHFYWWQIVQDFSCCLRNLLVFSTSMQSTSIFEHRKSIICRSRKWKFMNARQTVFFLHTNN